LSLTKAAGSLFPGCISQYTVFKRQGIPGRRDERESIPMRVGDASPIKYIFYVIRKTAPMTSTGDIPEGNGDPGLVLSVSKLLPISMPWPGNSCYLIIFMWRGKSVPMVTTGAWGHTPPIILKKTGLQATEEGRRL